MSLNEIDVKETFAVLAELKNLDLEKTSQPYIKGLLTRISKHIGVKQRVYRNRFIQRGILLDTEPEHYFPTEVQRISYNPKAATIGRANLEGHPVFYGCIATEQMEAYHCTGVETLPDIKHGFHKHRFVVGNWLLQDDAEFVILGGSPNLSSVCQDGLKRHQVFHRNIGNFKAEMIALYAIDRFICHEFSKEVSNKKPWEYLISATYATLLKEQGENGLIFPSVKAAGAGLNIVLFPEQVDRGLIRFDTALYGTYYRRHHEVCNEYTMKATAEGKNLVWTDAYYRLHNSIKEYYIGISNYNPLKNIPFADLGKPVNRDRL